MKRRVWQRADTIAAAAADRRAKPSQNRSRGQRSAEFCVDHPSPRALLYHASSCLILIAPVFMTRNTITDTVPGRRNRKSRPPVVVSVASVINRFVVCGRSP